MFAPQAAAAEVTQKSSNDTNEASGDLRAAIYSQGNIPTALPSAGAGPEKITTGNPLAIQASILRQQFEDALNDQHAEIGASQIEDLASLYMNYAVNTELGSYSSAVSPYSRENTVDTVAAPKAVPQDAEPLTYSPLELEFAQQFGISMPAYYDPSIIGVYAATAELNQLRTPSEGSELKRAYLAEQESLEFQNAA